MPDLRKIGASLIPGLLALILCAAAVAPALPAGEEASAAAPAAPEISEAQRNAEALKKAIDSNDMSALRELVDRLPETANAVIDDRPALHYCIKSGKLEAFTVLLEHMADPNILDNRKRTPLIYAAQMIRPAFIEELLKREGVRSHAVDDGNRTARSYLVDIPDERLQDLIKAEKRGESPEELRAQAQLCLEHIDLYQRQFIKVVAEKTLFDITPESLHDLLRTEMLGQPLWKYGLAFCIFLFVLILNAVFLWYLSHLSRVVTENKVHRHRIFLCRSALALRRGVRFFLWASAFYVSLGMLFPELYENVHWLRDSVLNITVALLLYDYTDVIEQYLRNWAGRTENRLDESLIGLFRRAMHMAIVLVAGLHLYHNISGQSLTGIIAGLGLGGMAVALAATDTIKNFIGFIMILIDKPFVVGDRINFDGHDGIVEFIGLRTTRVRRLDSHQVSIPNAKAVDSVLHNIGRRHFLKRTLDIGITYDTPADKIERALQIVRDLLKDHECSHSDTPPRVFFTDLKGDNLNINVNYWYFSNDWWAFCAFNERFNLALIRAFNEEGIEFAFPTQTLYLAGDPGRQLHVGLDGADRRAADKPATGES